MLPNKLVRIVKALRALVRVRSDSFAEQFPARSEVLARIEAAWEQQARRPSTKEIEAWVKVGRA